MVRKPYYDSNGMKKGSWSEAEDNKLRAYLMGRRRFHIPKWALVPVLAGLPRRTGKSSRLRWVNYLQPYLKQGDFDKYETDLIIKLHAELGSKWSAIAEHLPGRSDNAIKNYYNGHIKKRNRRNSAAKEQSHPINFAKATTHDCQLEETAPKTVVPKESREDFWLGLLELSGRDCLDKTHLAWYLGNYNMK